MGDRDTSVRCPAAQHPCSEPGTRAMAPGGFGRLFRAAGFILVRGGRRVRAGLPHVRWPPPAVPEALASCAGLLAVLRPEQN